VRQQTLLATQRLKLVQKEGRKEAKSVDTTTKAIVGYGGKGREVWPVYKGRGVKRVREGSAFFRQKSRVGTPFFSQGERKC
jgi:hypothetical protein